MRSKLILGLCLGLLLAVFMVPRQAQTEWVAVDPGGCGSSSGGCPTKEQVCSYWGARFGACLGNYTPAYNSDGVQVGYGYELWYAQGQEILNESTNPRCPDAQFPDRTVIDPLVTSGCSQFPGVNPKFLGPPSCSTSQGAPMSDNGCNPMVGNPIHVSTGNKFETVTDYESAGPNKLAFTRSYNSMARVPSMLGFGWQSNYDRRVSFDQGTPNSTTLHVIRGEGKQYDFRLSSGVWITESDLDATLTTDNATIWTFVASDDATETYDYRSGRLLSVKSRGGYLQTLQYDGSGQLKSVTDSYGRTLQFTFANGRLRTLTDPDGNVYTYAYDTISLPSDRLMKVTYPGSAPAPAVQYLYENATYPYALTGIIDENGNRAASWTYDAALRAVSSQHAGGADLTTLSFNLNSVGYGSVTVTNALGGTALYTIGWTWQGVKPTQIAEQTGANAPTATSFTSYDNSGYVNGRQDANGNVTNYTNDVHGRVITKVEAAGTALARTTTYTWDPVLHLVTQIVAPGRTTAFTYDASGNLLTKTETDTTTATVPYSTNGQTRSWSYTYSTTGQLLTATDPLNHATSYAYDASGALVSITNALGQQVQITSHDASGRPLMVVDANGATTTLAYDVRGRLTTVTAPGGAVTTISHDAVGNVTEIEQPDGSFLTYSFDIANRLTGIADSFGNSIAYTLDAMGNRTQTQIDDAGGHLLKTQSQVFDGLGRLIQSIGAGGQTTSFSYDLVGNETGITDPLSNKTTQSFDALNRLIKVAAPLSSTTNYAYDAHDNRTGTTDPRNLTTSSVYDGLDNLVQVTSPDTGTTVYHVDGAGNRTQATDAAGHVVQLSYDALNRVTAKTYPNDAAETIAYTYDEAAAQNGIGRLTSVSDASGSTAYVYDIRGNVTRETRVIGGVSYVTAYAYDLANHVTQVIYPSGRIVSYGRDAMGRISGITTQANAAAAAATVASSVSYLPFGPLSALTYGNGLGLTVQHDQDYRQTSRAVSTGTATAQSLSYAFDANSNITGITDAVTAARSQTFAYDALQRLTAASGLYGSLAYGYDAVGNRTAQSGGTNNLAETYTYAANSNRLQSVANGAVTRSLGYTAAGNLASDNRGGNALAFTYNEANRLVQVANNNTPVAAFAHNFLGERVAKSAGGTTTHFHYDRSGRLIAESDGSGNLLREHIWLDDMPVGFVSGGTLYYVHPDHLNTPQRLTDATGAVVWDQSLRPFGEVQASTFGLAENLRFPGQYADAETGLNYNYFRDYDPTIGRYVESDPTGLAGGVNLYDYADANPTNLVDFSGLASNSCDIKDRCAELRKQIFQKWALLVAELQKYNPVLDRMGGFSKRGGGLTKPGGHYEEIRNLQRGLKNDIAEYNRLCRNGGGDGTWSAIPRTIDEGANRPVETPPGLPADPADPGRQDSAPIQPPPAMAPPWWLFIFPPIPQS